MGLLDDYTRICGEDVINHLRQLVKPLQGMRVVHVNSTRIGGGVAEILEKLVPLTRELGLDCRWEVISGERDFYHCTKIMHNALQGSQADLPQRLTGVYERTAADNADALGGVLQEADVVFIHDPQPAPLITHFPDRKGKWIWRCHIDASRPNRAVWRYLRDFLTGYDASVFSLAAFAQSLPNPEYLVPPSIDPLSDKNIELPDEEIHGLYHSFGLNPERPLVTQVSRFDRFKDPLGVIHAWRMARRFVPDLQLVLAGGSATDDPEGEAVLQEVRAAAGDESDIHVLLLPPDSHRTINALQRVSDIVLQKSLREGFGLTVAEAMWKGRPVIGGDTGGIRLQLIDYHTGFRVNTPEGAALRIRYLLHNRDKAAGIGARGREFVRENFLLTRQLREYLTLIVALLHGGQERINLS